MELVGQFKRGSYTNKGGTKQKNEEAHKRIQDELDALKPSHSPHISPDASPHASIDTPNQPPGMRQGNKNNMLGVATPTAPTATIESKNDATETAHTTDWQEMSDPASGHPYWYNAATKVSSWTDPKQVEKATD